MAYKQIKLIDYVPCSTLTTLENAQARKAHYEGEVARVRAAELIQTAKYKGSPIMVQGSQND